MTLKETLEYIEAQIIHLNENVVGDYNKLKKKGFDDAKIYQMLSEIYKSTPEQIQQIMQTQQQQQQEFNQNQQKINNAKGTDRDNSSEVLDNLILKNSMQQNTSLERIDQQGNLFSYYQQVNAEDVMKKIESFDKLLSQTQDDLSKIIQSVQSFKDDPAVNEIITKTESELKAQKEKRGKFDWKKLWDKVGTALSPVKGILNTAAGMAGNFIGGIASGMGAAK